MSNHNGTPGKVVLITGASSGIGEATARVLAASGAKVVLGARRTERLEKIVAEIRQAGGVAEFRKLDVVDRADVNAFVDFARARFGRVDVIFNNAGVMPVSPMNALKTDEWDRIIDINIKGVLNGIAAVLPVMEAQGSGHIIARAGNVADIGALLLQVDMHEAGTDVAKDELVRHVVVLDVLAQHRACRGGSVV